MQKLSNVTTLFAIGFALYGCGKPPPPLVDFRGDSFEAPEADDVISPRFIRLSSFRVEGQDLDAHIEAAVKGKRGTDGKTFCEFVTSHKSFRSGRGWSPLPIVFFSPSFQSPDGALDLNDLFQQTLDFTNKEFDRTKISTTVAFTRSKVFRANWKFTPHLTTEGGAEVCTAVATVEKSSQVGCHASTCRIREAVGHVDGWRHLFADGKPEREKDDLSALILSLEDLDANGLPNGTVYPFKVPEFK